MKLVNLEQPQNGGVDNFYPLKRPTTEVGNLNSEKLKFGRLPIAIVYKICMGNEESRLAK